MFVEKFCTTAGNGISIECGANQKIVYPMKEEQLVQMFATQVVQFLRTIPTLLVQPLENSLIQIIVSCFTIVTGMTTKQRLLLK